MTCRASGLWAAHTAPARGRDSPCDTTDPARCPDRVGLLALSLAVTPSLHRLRRRSFDRPCSAASSVLCVRSTPQDRASPAYVPPDFPARPGAAHSRLRATLRPPRFRRVPFGRDGVLDHGRASAPRLAAPHVLPSTIATVSASARSLFSRLNSPPCPIAVYASSGPSPAKTQHSLLGGPLRPYPGGTSTRWNAPASPGASAK